MRITEPLIDDCTQSYPRDRLLHDLIRAVSSGTRLHTRSQAAVAEARKRTDLDVFTSLTYSACAGLLVPSACERISARTMQRGQHDDGRLSLTGVRRAPDAGVPFTGGNT